jgi:hypothetical protein
MILPSPNVAPPYSPWEMVSESPCSVCCRIPIGRGYNPPLQGEIFMIKVMATGLFEEAAFLILRICLRLQELDQIGSTKWYHRVVLLLGSWTCNASSRTAMAR